MELLLLILLIGVIGLYLSRVFADKPVNSRPINRFDPVNRTVLEADTTKQYTRLGYFQHSPEAPDYAEQIGKSNHCQRVEKKGKYGGTIGSYDHVIYPCPKCNTVHELLFEHGDTIKCQCGLYSQTHGNSLKVWE